MQAGLFKDKTKKPLEIGSAAIRKRRDYSSQIRTLNKLIKRVYEEMHYAHSSDRVHDIAKHYLHQARINISMALAVKETEK